MLVIHRIYYDARNHKHKIKSNLQVLSVDKKCETTVSPTAKGLTITPTTWQNLYFKEQITIVGLNRIIPQI